MSLRYGGVHQHQSKDSQLPTGPEEATTSSTTAAGFSSDKCTSEQNHERENEKKKNDVHWLHDDCQLSAELNRTQ